MDLVACKRLLARHGMEAIRCMAAVSAFFDQDACGKGLEAVLNSGDCFSLDQLAVGGKDLIALGLPPGTQIGQILEELLDHVIQYPGDNQRDILLAQVNRQG